MSRWRPLDIIILILSLTVCGMLMASVVEILMNPEVHPTPGQSDNLLNLVLALTAIINGYVVSTLQTGFMEERSK